MPVIQISGRSNRTQCRQRLAIVATLLRKELCCLGAMTRRWAPPTRYTLWRNAASKIKDLIICFNPILQVLKIDANSETLCRFDTVKFKRL